MDYKRATERADVDLNIPIELHRILFSGKTYQGDSLARNVSLGGMRLEISTTTNLDKSIELGTPIALVMTLPNGNPFAVNGLVRHTITKEKRLSLGIKFLDLDEDATVELDNYISMRKFLAKRREGHSATTGRFN